MIKKFETQEELSKFLDEAPTGATFVIGNLVATCKPSGTWTANKYMGGADSIASYKVAEHAFAEGNTGVVTSIYGTVEINIKEARLAAPPLDTVSGISKLLGNLPVDSIIMVEYFSGGKYKQTFRKSNAFMERWVSTHVGSRDSLIDGGWDKIELNSAKKVWVVYDPTQHNPPRPEYVAKEAKLAPKYKLSNMNPCRVVESATGETIATFAKQNAAEEFVKEMNK